jgi:hypothetical protein
MDDNSTTTTTNDPLDAATSQRLAKLRTMPVDTSRLDKLIQAKIPKPQIEAVRSSRPSILFRIRPLRAIAASIVMLGIVGVILWSLSGGAVMAAPDMMAKFHEDLVTQKVHTTQVASISDANKALAEEWTKNVEIPHVPSAHAMMCCMRSIEDKRVACVLLRSEGDGGGQVDGHEDAARREDDRARQHEVLRPDFR